MRVRYEMRAHRTPGRPDQVEILNVDMQGELVPLLDETEDPPMTVEEIGKCTSADELRACWLKVQELPLSKVERTAMEAAVRARAETLNLNWSFEPYDGGTMMAAAVALQDSFGRPALVSILDDTPGKPLRVRFKATEANVISLNERLYLREILSDAVDRAAARIQAGQATFGEYGHPPMDVTDAQGRKRFRRTRSRAVLMPEGLNMQGTEVFLDARILEDTEPGKQTATDLRAGNPVYVSTRAYGGDLRVVPLNDGRQVKVPLYMDLETWDRVDNPAIPDAAPVGMLDSVQLQAICDAVQLPARAPAAPAATSTPKEGFRMNKEMIAALAQTEAGRRQLVLHLGTAGITDEIRTAITDALATPLTPAAPAAAPAPQIDVQKAVTDALNQKAEEDRQKAETARLAREEAKNYVTAEIKAMRDGNRFPAPLIDSIQSALADAPDKATAESLLKTQIAMADSVMPAAHLVALGYGAPAGQAQALHLQVRENQAWKPIVDNLLSAFDDFRLTSYGERPDVELRKVNKPFVDKLMAKFDRQNAKAMVDAVNGWNAMTDAITTTDLWTQPIVQRALLEQAFGDADMLQFVGTDVFEGDTMLIPVEYYEGSGAISHKSGEMQPMATGSIKTTWIPVSASPRRIAAEISNETMRGMASGPLRYNASARALYHIMAEVRRAINIEAGNEMLRASDAYGAVAVSAEKAMAKEVADVTDDTNVKYKVTLRRGGTTDQLTATHKDRPVVKPRVYTSYANNGQATTVVENGITVTIDGDAVTMRDLRTNADGTVSIVNAAGTEAAGFAVDFENGYLYVSDDYTIVSTAGSEDTLVSYTYGTNFATFSLTPDTGVDPADHYNGLLRLIGFQAALMGAHPRYIAPNIALGSMTAMEYVINASLFENARSPKGTILNAGTGNYVGSRNGVDYAKHNTRWAAGDARILLGRAMATKFAVRDPLAPKGPFPSYDTNGKILPAEQWYVEGFDALITPEVRNQAGTTLNPYFRTIKLKA